MTSDEGNNPNQTIATVVVTNHGPRGLKDSTSYSHFSLLASLEGAFGLSCLQNACTATPMTPLFQVTGVNDHAGPAAAIHAPAKRR